MSQAFKLLIFDWDGTLMDSQALIVDCFKIAIAELGLQPRSAYEIKQVVGLGLYEGFEALCSDGSAALLKQGVNIYRENYFSSMAKPTPLFHKADEVLQSLYDAGYQMAVATGKGRRGLNDALDKTGLRDLFHSTRCAEETTSKPNPQMLYEILEELDTDASQAVMIGDSLFDLEMANNADMASIAVSYGLQEKQRLLSCNPLTCLDDVTELPTWLDS
ncbi:HAD-IA family hydrolase [Candidatus Albibeggiatoa sp. nov. BB20]|uniref:HAD family hydrolase n=1 Tax=Candidatus Albibeggiatoa sp. nov. BB20 TaxID=3162723 RepID=UPI0033655184